MKTKQKENILTLPTRLNSLTEKEKDDVEKLASVLTAVQIGDFLGITRNNFDNIMKNDPTVSARYKKGRAKVIGAIAQNIIQKALGGDISAAVFYLKTHADWGEK